MQRDLRWLVAGLGLSASALAALGCDTENSQAPAPTATITAVPTGSDGERIHPPEGQWCAKPELAKGLVILGSPEVDGCAKFLDGARIPKEKELSPEYIEMPRSTYGFYDDILTKMRRSAINHAPLCCYRWREKTPGGRPLVERRETDVALVAPLLAEGSAQGLPRLQLLQPPPALAGVVFDHWRRQAQLEHASVAAFARARLELLELGAPRALVSRYAAAARDELRHAELCLAVLRAWGQPTLGFGPMGLPGSSGVGSASRREALEALAERTVDEAFEPEAAAAMALHGAVERCACPDLACLIASIAEDERSHARLALDTVRWCLTESNGELPPRKALPEAAKAASHSSADWGVIVDDAWALARQRCRALSSAAVA
ncbi:MAG: hypothetical protein R3B89_20290 [Polyangiaceae bacterium]